MKKNERVWSERKKENGQRKVVRQRNYTHGVGCVWKMDREVFNGKK